MVLSQTHRRHTQGVPSQDTDETPRDGDAFGKFHTSSYVSGHQLKEQKERPSHPNHLDVEWSHLTEDQTSHHPTTVRCLLIRLKIHFQLRLWCWMVWPHKCPLEFCKLSIFSLLGQTTFSTGEQVQMDENGWQNVPNEEGAAVRNLETTFEIQNKRGLTGIASGFTMNKWCFRARVPVLAVRKKKIKHSPLHFSLFYIYPEMSTWKIKHAHVSNKRKEQNWNTNPTERRSQSIGTAPWTCSSQTRSVHVSKSPFWSCAEKEKWWFVIDLFHDSVEIQERKVTHTVSSRKQASVVGFFGRVAPTFSKLRHVTCAVTRCLQYQSADCSSPTNGARDENIFANSPAVVGKQIGTEFRRQIEQNICYR